MVEGGERLSGRREEGPLVVDGGVEPAGWEAYGVSKGRTVVIPEKSVNLREERDEQPPIRVAGSTGRAACVAEGGVL